MNICLKSTFTLILFFLQISMLNAYEKSDTFYITVHDKKSKVLAPSKFKNELSVIVENKMTHKLLGKLVKGSGKRVGFFSIEPRKNASLDVKITTKDRLFFIPLSPAFQEVELKIGKKSYEIPPQR